MTGKKIGVAILGLLLGLTATGVRADDPPADKADNPLFTAWSKFDVGASATYEGDVDTPDGKKHITGKDTLKEKNADSVKIESTKQDGDQKEDPSIQTFPAKLDAASVKKTGEQDVKAMDKTWKCSVYDLTFAAVGENDDMKMTVYVCDEVPGGLVKVVFHTDDGKDMTFMVTATTTK